VGSVTKPATVALLLLMFRHARLEKRMEALQRVKLAGFDIVIRGAGGRTRCAAPGDAVPGGKELEWAHAHIRGRDDLMTDAKADAGTLLYQVIADAQAISAAREGKQPEETLKYLVILLNGPRASTAQEVWNKALGGA
jgi:hypothetical protein